MARNPKKRGNKRDAALDNARLDFANNKCVVVNGGGVQNKRFNFDYVFEPGSGQDDLFEQVAKATVADILQGYNGTIFAYGQTGSGKTYTMFGTPKQKGIIPRCAEALFDGIQNAKAEVSEVYIKCSFVEIYQENVRDLLNPTGKKLRIREKQDGSTYIEGAAEEYCENPGDIYKVIEEGNKHRAVASTDMNSTSSRSHSVLIISLTQRLSNGTQLEGGLNLADLAGSERLDRTNVSGIGLQEAKKINQSLSALGNCINALTDRTRTHIPFRDSVLTYLLKDALGGNSKTVLVVCCSPDGIDVFETLSTLRFAERAKKVKNNAQVNTRLTVEQYQKLVEDLKRKLKEREKLIGNLKKALANGGQISPEMLKALSEGPEQARPMTASSLSASGGLLLDDDSVAVADTPRRERGSVMMASQTHIKEESFVIDDNHDMKDAESFLHGLKADLESGEVEQGSEAHMRELSNRFIPEATSPLGMGRPGSFIFPDHPNDESGDVVSQAENFLKSFQGGELGELLRDGAIPEELPTPRFDPNTPHATPQTTPGGAFVTPKKGNMSPEEMGKRLAKAACYGDWRTYYEMKMLLGGLSKGHLILIHQAVKGGSKDIVKDLLEAKAQIDALDEDGKTPLMQAVIANDTRSVQFLVESDASLDMKDQAGSTALIHSAKGGHQQITQVLIEAKADVNIKDKEGLSAADHTRLRAKEMIEQLATTEEKRQAEEAARKKAEEEKKAKALAEARAKAEAEREPTAEELEAAVRKYESDSSKGDVQATLRLAKCYMEGKGVPRNHKKGFELYNSEVLAEEPVALLEMGRCHHLGLGTAKDLRQAINCYQKAAEMGNPDARCELAWCFATGEGIPKEVDVAHEIFSEVAETEHAGAICGLGYCYQRGLGVEVDEKKAIAQYQKSASLGHAAGYTFLGRCYLHGKDKDDDKAFELFKEASDRGDRVGKYHLARMYYEARGVEKDAAKAVKLFQEAAVLGDTEALLRLGRCYMKGDGTERNPSQAVKLYQRAADRDHTGGMIALGECYEKASGVNRDFMKAAELYQRAADAGDPRAILKLGECYENAKGVKKSAEEAVKHYRRAQEAGLNEATTRLAWCYAMGIGVEKDGKKAFEMHTLASGKGSKEALRGLGYCYEKGLGVQKSNLRKAVQMYQKAAEAGNATAWSDLANCVVNASGMSRNNQKAFLLFKKSASMGDAVGNRKLGWCYVKGIGVEKDVKKGVNFYHRAADMGDSMAISSLGVCYAKGMGVKKDQVKAFELFKRAAEMGNPTDICNLGVCYKKGTGVTVDHKKAAELYQKAADMGDAAAICNLGVCYYNGTGVTKDIDKALSFWHDAANMGNSAAKHNLERCRKAKDRKNTEKVLLLASLNRLLPPIIEQKSVLERKLFKGPIVELEPDEQVKRRNYVMDALKATVENIQKKQREEAKKQQESKGEQSSSEKKMENRLQQLLKSCEVLITLLEEPQKRTLAVKIVKPVRPGGRRG